MAVLCDVSVISLARHGSGWEVAELSSQGPW